MGCWGLSCCCCGHLSTLFIWLGGFCHAATQRRLGPLRSSGCCLSSKSLHPRLGVGMEKVWLPIFSAFVEDRNGNVAWSELGVYRVAFSSGQQPGAFTGRAIGRGCSFLGTLGGHAWVVPRSGATVVVHEEGPAGLRVDLDLPARGQGLSVTGSVAGRHLHHWRLGSGAHAGSGSARGAELGRG